MNKHRLITYQEAQKEIIKLKNYISLIDNYEIDSLDKFIIKNYAIYNSSSSVIRKFNESDFYFKNLTLTREYIFEVINSSPIDELHKIIQRGYQKKYKRKTNNLH